MGYNSLNSIRESINEEYYDRIMNKFDDRIQAISSVSSDFTDEKAVKLGILLENTDEHFKRAARVFESTQTANVEGGLKNTYFDIISLAYPNCIAEELFSVQPITNKIGQIFYLDYQYGTNKGSITSGSTIFSKDTIDGYHKNPYSGERIDTEEIAKGDGTSKKLTGNFSFVPVMPGSVSILSSDNTPVNIKDDGAGVLKNGSTAVGTVDYTSGAFEINFDVAPASTVTYDADYEYNEGYAPATIPEVNLSVGEATIKAYPHKLRGTYSLDAGYDLRMSQGVDINEALIQAAAVQLRHETDGDLIQQAFSQAANTTSWTNSYNANTSTFSKKDYYEEFIEVITKASSQIFQSTKRLSGSWIVCGKKAADILSFIGAPRFIRSNNALNQAGPHFAGVLDNNMRVYFDHFLDESQFIVGHKGDTLLDAGLVYAPYLPFFATNPVMLDDFLGRRGFATFYGKKMINSKLFVAGTIS